AISIAGGVVGRNIKETKDEIFYINIPEKDFKLIKQKFKKELTFDDKEILEEFVAIKRKDKKFWGL
ncbi:MAG: translation initiation factor IF-2, partial [Candidatus Helarchaeota archaeon]|nr:translation initiation factor IF-2 [Candidatus Helarchaeota archaeon]